MTRTNGRGGGRMKKPIKLTDDQKKRLAPMLCRTWSAIADDCAELEGELTTAVIVELTCDANRPMMYGGMNAEDDKLLSAAYWHEDTQKWLKGLLG